MKINIVVFREIEALKKEEDMHMKKSVKKIIKIVVISLVSIMIFLFVAGFLFITYTFEDEGKKDGWSIAQNRLTKRCAVCHYVWKGDTENMELWVPDTYKGHKVTQLGEVRRTSPFCVVLDLNGMADGEVQNWVTQDVPDEAPPTYDAYETLTFTIHIGENIKKVESMLGEQYYLQYEHNQIVNYRYKVEYNYICSKKNPVFYSRDGVLYYKKNDEPVPCN